MLPVHTIAVKKNAFTREYMRKIIQQEVKLSSVVRPFEGFKSMGSFFYGTFITRVSTNNLCGEQHILRGRK